MKIQWHQLILKIIFWLVAEIILTLVGLDNMADYSEFLLTPRGITFAAPTQAIHSPR